jgi:hypothetical protein
MSPGVDAMTGVLRDLARRNAAATSRRAAAGCTDGVGGASILDLDDLPEHLRGFVTVAPAPAPAAVAKAVQTGVG